MLLYLLLMFKCLTSSISKCTKFKYMLVLLEKLLDGFASVRFSNDFS